MDFYYEQIIFYLIHQFAQVFFCINEANLIEKSNNYLIL